nr:secoisolariciresinol dehydrogenase-like [Ipomoea batatas]
MAPPTFAPRGTLVTYREIGNFISSFNNGQKTRREGFTDNGRSQRHRKMQGGSSLQSTAPKSPRRHPGRSRQRRRGLHRRALQRHLPPLRRDERGTRPRRRHKTVETFGKLDIMFANAGIADPNKPRIVDNTKSDFERVLSINVTGSLPRLKHAARVMVPRPAGLHIIHLERELNLAGAASHAYAAVEAPGCLG